MTTEKNRYEYDAQSGIMFKYYYGEITYEDFAGSWEKAFDSGAVPKGILKFLIDYTEATFKIKPAEYIRIAEFYRHNLTHFKKARIAIVVSNHKDIVIPKLVETKDSGYISKTFSSRQAALNWLKY